MGKRVKRGLLHLRCLSVRYDKRTHHRIVAFGLVGCTVLALYEYTTVCTVASCITNLVWLIEPEI